MSDFSLSAGSFSAVTFIHTLGISGSIILRETKVQFCIIVFCMYFLHSFSVLKKLSSQYDKQKQNIINSGNVFT